MAEQSVAAQTGVFEQALHVCDPEKSPAVVVSVPQVTALIGKLRDTGDCSRYLQGGCLNYLYENDRWKQDSKLPFRDYCPKVLGIGYRPAMYLIRVYLKAKSLGLTPTKLQEAGWAKSRELLRVATSETLEEWLERAKSMTAAQITEAVTKERAKRRADDTDEDTDDLMVTLQVRMTEEQRENVEACIEQVAGADQKTAPLSRGDALDLICTDYRANAVDPEQSLEWHLANLQRAYGVKLAKVEAPTNETMVDPEG
jgi:hypothetical protein